MATKNTRYYVDHNVLLTVAGHRNRDVPQTVESAWWFFRPNHQIRAGTTTGGATIKKRRKTKAGVQEPGNDRQYSLQELVRTSLYETVLSAGLLHVKQVLEEERAAV